MPNEFTDSIPAIDESPAVTTTNDGGAALQPVPVPNEFAQAVEDNDREQLQPLAGSLYAASKIDPERRAKVLKVADTTGLNADLVDRNLEYFSGISRFDKERNQGDLAAIAKNRPALAQWLLDRDNAAISQDDHVAVHRIDSALRQINPPAVVDPTEQLPWYQSIGATLRKGVVNTDELILAIPGILQQATRDLFGVTSAPAENSPLGIIYSGEDMIAREKKAWDTYRETTAQQLTLPVIGMAADPINMIAPLGAGEFAAKSVTSIAAMVREATALRAAAGVMGIESGAGELGETLKARQQAGEIPEKGILPTPLEVTHASLQAALGYLAGKTGGLIGPLRSLREATPTVAEAGMDIVRNAVLGGSQSTGSQAIRDAFDGRMPSTGELAMAYLTGGISGGAMAALNFPSAFAHVQASRFADRQIEAHIARDGAESLAAASVAIENSKTHERSSLRTKALMDLIVQHSGQAETGSVFLQSLEWNAHWTKAGLDPEQVATSLTGNPKAYAEAVATGGAIEIPQGEFLSKLSGTDHFAKLLNKASLSPGAPTLEQANETFKNFSAELQQLHERIRTEVQTGQGVVDQSAESVYQDILKQRTAAGAAPEVAKQEATLWQAAMEGITRQFNANVTEGGKQVSAADLYRSLRLQIHRQLPDMLAGLEKDASVEPMLNELRHARATQENVKDRGAVHLPQHLRQIDEALRAAGIDIAAHPTNETVFSHIRDGLLTQANEAAAGAEHVVKGHRVITAEVPYGAGTSADGRTVYIDKRIPRFIEIDGKRVDVHELIAEHEIREKADMATGKSYAEAHADALKIEHQDAAAQHGGISPKDYEKAIRPYIEAALKEAKPEGIPADLERQPYVDMKQERLVEGASADPLDLAHGSMPVTLEQGMRLNAPDDGSLDKQDLRELWQRAHGDRTPDESSDEWRALVKQSREIDRAHGRTFQQGAENRAHGSITFGDLATVIRLFQSENLSTFSHESAHAWLHAFASLADRADAPADMKAEWSSILKWLDVSSSAEIGTKQHEQWAESWEHYLREGKAPKAELRGAFARVKAWMLQVYSDIKDIYRSTGGRVKLTDEMRGIFDRMLASRDEIAAANEKDAADPLFSTAAQAGMSEPDFAAYQKRAIAERQARQDLLERKLVSSFMKERTRLYEGVRGIVRGEVAHDLNAQQDLAAVALLQRGRLPDGTPLEGPSIKLDRAELVKAFGQENLEHLPGTGGTRANQKNRGPMVYAKEGGLPIDVVAESLGYASGSELFHALINAPDLKTTIEKLTDERMLERFPDPMQDGTIAERVVEATHESEKRAAVMDEEAQALGRMLNQQPSPRQLMTIIAKDTIGSMRPKNIRPDVYRTAEATANREAWKAVGKGDMAKALVEKQRAQLNHELCKAAVAAKQEAKDIRDHLASLSKPAARERIGKAGGWEWTVTRADGSTRTLGSEAEARSVAEANPGATFSRSSSYLDAIDRVLAGVELAKVSQTDLQRREALAQFELDQNLKGNPIFIPLAMIAEARTKNWQQLSIHELRGLDDAVANIEHTARLKNRTLADQRAATFADLTSKVGANIIEFSKGPREERLGTGILSPITDGAGKIFDYQKRVADIIYRINGHKEGGDLFWNWQHPLNEAGDREGNMQAAAVVEQNRIMDKWGKLGRGDIHAAQLNRQEYIPEIKRGLNKWAQIMFALNYGNLGNRERLMEGMKINDFQAQAVLDKLDAKDWGYVNDILKHVNSYWSEIAALEQRVHGVAPEKVEAAPFMTKHGEQPGGYFPIKYDNRLSPAPAHETPESEAQGLLAGRGPGYAMTSHGHTEARQGSQGRPLSLDFNGIANHLNRVVKDLSQRETLMGLNKLLRSEEFQQPLVEHWGKRTWDQFKFQLESAARGPATADTGMEKVLGFLRQGGNASMRAFNVAYAAKQFAGMPAAIPRLGLKNFLRALVPAFTPHGHVWADEHSTSLRLRGQLHDKSLNESVSRTSSLAPLAPIARTAYLFAGKAWKIMDTHAWYAGFYKAMNLPEVNGDPAKAVKIADQILNDTQGGFLPKDMPQMLRGGELAKVFTNNMSWANANFNLMANSVYRFADKGFTAGAAAHMASDMLVYLVVAPTLYAWASDAIMGDQSMDWTDGKSIAKRVGSEGLYTAAGSMPGLREFSAALTEGRRAELPQGLSALGTMENLVASIHHDVMKDEDTGASSATKRGLLKASGIIFHFPTSQILHSIDGWTWAQENGGNPFFRTVIGAPPRK